MIVRILSENQYRIDDANTAANRATLRLDAQLLADTETSGRRGFQEMLAALIGWVHKCGQILPTADLTASDVRVPPTISTLAETKQLAEKAIGGEGQC